MWKISTILIFGFFIRIISINWDNGIHLHPDERALMMTTSSLHFFDKLNPHMFNYGSLPIYILKGLGQLIDFLFNTNYAMYGQMLYLGRFLSVLVDIGIIFLIYKISLLVFKKRNIAILGSFLYSIAFFPIQNSHFFIVDVFLNFFILFTFYRLLIYIDKPIIKNLIFISIIYAASFTSKFTAIVFLPLIIIYIFISGKSKIKDLIVFILVFILFSFIFMPYMFIEYQNYIKDVAFQLRLNNNAYAFPYTLQYIGTIPYIYYLKNIFLWGLGPLISLLVMFGICLVFWSINNKKGEKLEFNYKKLLLFSIFYLFYFIIIGKSAVKFMRYMLLIYPFLIVFAGYGLYYIYKKINKLFVPLIILMLIWSYMFIQINSKSHSRVDASNWILENIPYNLTLATEHWDDRIPFRMGEDYKYQELTLYDQPDNSIKWSLLNNKLRASDYIIISSNRLYVPLTRLSDCGKYIQCYPLTSKYYKNLFDEKLGFKKIAEFTSYPKIEIGKFKFEIIDDSADESFTVYDHPKVMIFKKVDIKNE
jgi:hypothetical protein